MKLNGNIAIVTGAGRNIGEETAKVLAAEGAKVGVVDLDGGRAAKVAGEIRSGGGEAEPFIANVALEADIQKLVRDVTAKWGRIDVLINNVAISDNKTILDITKEEWDRVIGVTLTGPFLMAKYVAQHMVEHGTAGRIVNVGSTSGIYGRPRAIAYTAAKGGLMNLSRSMAQQLAKHNIRVTTVVPNKIGSPVGKDEFDPTRPVKNLRGRPGLPMDMARAILFLISDDADFIAGTELYVDGGVTSMMPGSE